MQMAYSAVQAGPGDMETWGACDGHPMDPRTEGRKPEGCDPDLIADDAIDAACDLVRQARSAMARGHMLQGLDLLRDAGQRLLDAADDIEAGDE